MPVDWLDENHAAVGGAVPISVPDCGIEGMARVLDIRPCPPIEPGSGRVVTGLFRHVGATTIDLHIAGQTEPIGCTGNHQFWSETRQTFVRADALQPGEEVRTVGGLSTVRYITDRAASEDVFNLEVHGEHVYHVGSLGVLAHNGNQNNSCRTYVSYIADDLDNPGFIYNGRASGVDMTPEEILMRRKSGHHRNLGPLQLDQVTTSYPAIRGREQLVRNKLVQEGIGTNQINPISPRNKNINTYLEKAIEEFGEL